MATFFLDGIAQTTTLGILPLSLYEQKTFWCWLIKTSNATKRWFMTVTLDFNWKAKLMIEIPPAASQVQNTKGTRKETIINYYYSQLLCAM